MRRSVVFGMGSRWIVAIIAALGLVSVLAPGGQAQTLSAPLPELPALPQPLPSLPEVSLDPSPAPPIAPAPSLPALPLPVDQPSDLVSPTLNGVGSLVPLGEAPVPDIGDGAAAELVGGGSASGAGADTRQATVATRSGGTVRGPLAGFMSERRNKPLRGAPLRRLRERLIEHWSCAAVLARPQRRVLVLRAGLFGRRPAAWRGVARRVGVSLPRAVRLARSGIARLSRAGTCIDAGGAALGTSIYPAASQSGVAAGSGGDETTPTRRPEVSGVLGVSEIRPDVRLRALNGADDPAPEWLLAFLAILLALLGALALAARGGYVPMLVPARRFEDPSEKPLLFLAVEGVVSVRPLPGYMPPGRWHQIGLVQAYVAESAGEHVRALESRYEIVWATGWTHGANRYFRPLLGLGGDLRVLEPGVDAAAHSSDWKIREITQLAGSRPVAWVDDDISGRHERWSRSRRAPTLLVKTDPHRGISERDVAHLIEWADTLGPLVNGGHLARPARGARTPAGR